jgi:hypothetical protein
MQYILPSLKFRCLAAFVPHPNEDQIAASFFLPASYLQPFFISSCFRSIDVPASELQLLPQVLLSKVTQALQLSSLRTPEHSRRPYKYPQMFHVRWHMLSSCLCLQVAPSMASILQLHFLVHVVLRFPPPAGPLIMVVDSTLVGQAPHLKCFTIPK